MSFSPATDLTGWRLSVANGRQTWSYAAKKEDRERAQSFLEAVALGLEVSHLAKYHSFFSYQAPPQQKATASLSPLEAIKAALNYYSKLQTEDGHWSGDYGGPLFLMPGAIPLVFTIINMSLIAGLIIVQHVTGAEFQECQRLEMIRYLRNVQNPDGGWGL